MNTKRNVFNLKKYKKLRQKLRNNVPNSERRLWQRLRRKQLGFKFRRQCGISTYIVDFYCFQLNLIIEVDGCSHDGTLAYKKDILREKYLKSIGLHIKRYSAKLIINELDRVVEDIFKTCNHLLASSSKEEER